MPSVEPNITLGLTDLEHSSYVVPLVPSWTGQLAQTVCNPDGSFIGSSAVAGSATSANQALEIAALNEIATDTDHLDVNLSTLATQTTLAEIAIDTDHLDANLSTLATSANQTNGNQKALNTAQLVPVAFDTIQVTAVDGSDNPTTILYKTGGLAGSTVATLTVVYDGSGNFQSVVRT